MRTLHRHDRFGTRRAGVAPVGGRDLFPALFPTRTTATGTAQSETAQRRGFAARVTSFFVNNPSDRLKREMSKSLHTAGFGP